jgi:tripartite-type tricarboxylate transporter receptor subunit TctC
MESTMHLTNTSRRRLITRAAAAAVTIATPALAQSRYPNRPITLVVPFPPGGSVDIAARMVNDCLGKLLGQPVVIDNRAGAGGSVGAAAVARAAPDGYTLIVASQSTHVTNPVLQPKLPYDALADFAPITLINRVANALVVHPSLPVKTLSEFVQYAKARPGKLDYGSPGIGSLSHLSMEYVKATLGVFLTHIPYRGGGPALNDLLAGTVQVMWDNYSPVLPHLQAGKLRGLAIASPQRAVQTPDVPTFAELQLPLLNLSSWAGLAAPARTPEPIIALLYEAMKSILSDPANKDVWQAKGVLLPEALRPSEYAEEIRQRMAIYKGIVQANGIKLDS